MCPVQSESNYKYASDLKTHILEIIVNRPDAINIVFDDIAKAKPGKMFVITWGQGKGVLNYKMLCREKRRIIDNYGCQRGRRLWLPTCPNKLNFSKAAGEGCGYVTGLWNLRKQFYHF